MRIASLLPSATEIVASLGLADQLVGVSHCCDYPPEVSSLPVVTRSVVDPSALSGEIDQTVREHLTSNTALYTLDTDLLQRLEPDIVISQGLCDVCAVSGEDAEAALRDMRGNPKLINLEPFSLQDVLQTIRIIGGATGVKPIAEAYVERLRKRIASVDQRSASKVTCRPEVALLDWIDPPFTGGHWIADLIETAGGRSTLNLPDKPSRTVSWEEVEHASADVLIIACCGFDVNRTLAEIERTDGLTRRLDEFQSKGTKVHVLDGNFLFSRPGPRLVESLETLAHCLHPDIHPAFNSLDEFR